MLKEFLKNIQNENFGLIFLGKGQILMPFSGLAPSKLIFFSKQIKGNYVYMEESFDTIFNMGYGSGKSPMGESVEYP